MIISRTPFRISFFGGGTDYPPWYKEHGGAVLSTSFDKYCYITCRPLPPFFDHKYRIAYSKVENVRDIAEIEHPAVRAILAEMNFDCGLEVHCDSDLPARSGLGTSSSFVVGMLHSLTALRGKRVTQDWLAREAIRVEQVVMRENVGSQDQTAAAHGGLNLIRFMKDGSIKVEPIVVPDERKRNLNDHLMLFFTGFSRISSDIAKTHVANLNDNSASLHRMRAMVDEAIEILCDGRDIRAFGELLHAGWMEKRALSDKVSNDSIDALYQKARQAGALGGKLLGAGGGGFLLLFAAPERHAAIREVLRDLILVPFSFETSGSQVIYYQP
ncbi:MAG: kinase [Proteobacteria bacterium]|nr:kinase [Pseudomonadota bacterium]HQR04682.1 kinase [Rhodocyclaceae bacterium]